MAFARFITIAALSALVTYLTGCAAHRDVDVDPPVPEYRVIIATSLGPSAALAFRDAAGSWERCADVSFHYDDAPRAHAIRVVAANPDARWESADMWMSSSYGDRTIGVVSIGTDLVEVFAHELGHALGFHGHLREGVMRAAGSLEGERVTCREVEAIGLPCRC